MPRDLRPSVRDARGLTLTELVVTIALFAIVMAAVVGTWGKAQEAYFVGSESAEIQQNVRAAIDFMVRELRSAGRDVTVCAFDYATSTTTDCDGAKVSELHHETHRERHADLADGQRPRRPRLHRALRDPLRRGDRHHPAHPLRPQSQRADRRAGNAITSPASAADRGEEDVLYALSTSNCPPGVAPVHHAGRRHGPVAMVAVDINGLTFTYFPRANFGPCAGVAESVQQRVLPAADQPGPSRQHRAHSHFSPSPAADGRADGEPHARHRGHAQEPLVRGDAREDAMLHTRRIGPDHRRHRHAHPRDPELLVRAPLADRDDDRASTTSSRPRPRPWRKPGSSAGGTQVRPAANEACGFTKWTDPAGSSSLRLRPRAGEAPLQRGRPRGRELLGRHRQRLRPARARLRSQDPSCGGALARAGHERDGDRHGVGDHGERAGAYPSASDPGRSTIPGSTSARTRARTTPPATATSRQPEREPDPSCRPTRTSTRAGPRPTTTCPDADAGMLGDRSYCFTVNVVGCWRGPQGGDGRPVPVRNCDGGAGRPSKGNCDSGTYQGYFDCALTTPCDRPACVAARPASRPATRATTTRTTSRFPRRACRVPPAATRHGVRRATRASTMWATSAGPTVGTPTSRGNALREHGHVMNGARSRFSSATFYGILVVEGDGQRNCDGSNRDMKLKNQSRIMDRRQTNTNATAPRTVYGYPLAFLIYDPQQPPAPAANPVVPQNTFADMGSAAGTEIHGIVYSGGNVEFNPINVDGGVVAFQIQTQSTSSSYGYNSTYGNAAPPPGFPEARAIPWFWCGSRSSSAPTTPPTPAAAVPASKRPLRSLAPARGRAPGPARRRASQKRRGRRRLT